ncbi:MAG: pyridoxamine 5'-phosphate oxidase family protein [Gammaproteobacteria bacterium]|nr:pyridoxamine 5'-phosphate oxidase family protein [Gammaproteobacteria bacterium]MCF6260107.1 pyridoxamine 5'-phosphate oxidase family protein [Gammaproteobacteria bacterium]
MGKQYDAIPEKLNAFITAQKIFFVGTAGSTGKVNISPKGMDSFRIIDEHTVHWLNVTGSGNETAAHVLENQRMTIMFCAFEGKPMILRLYGMASMTQPKDPEWEQHSQHFPDLPGARQIFTLNIDLVQRSCGMAVPFYDYQDERDQLKHWAEVKGTQGVEQYWKDKNTVSLDGKPTGI